MTQSNERIAALAAELFHEHGINSTGVDALSRAAGISKRTLYERFGSKDGLIVAAYDSLDVPVFRMFTEAAERAATAPREQIDELFAGLERMVGLPEFRGCPFSNAASELSDLDHPAHEVVRRHKERLRCWIFERARAVGAEDPDALSRRLMLLFAGAQSQSLVQRSAAPARDARELARVLVDAAVEGSVPRAGSKNL